jgi:hypothetical protein
LLQARAINLSIHSLSTFSNRKLLFETRHTAFKDKKFESVWTFAGKIYARKNENAVKIRIRNQRDIVTKIVMNMERESQEPQKSDST